MDYFKISYMYRIGLDSKSVFPLANEADLKGFAAPADQILVRTYANIVEYLKS